MTFVDDDGWVSHNYAEVISDALTNNRSELDVLLYDVVATVESELPRGLFLSFDLGNSDLPDCYLRLPNHLMVWRRDVVLREPFAPLNKGEDADWAGRLRAHVSVTDETDYAASFVVVETTEEPR